MTSRTSNLAGMRRDYLAEGSAPDAELAESDLAASWPAQFGRWLDAAIESGLPEPNAMIVATASAAGAPSARTVLLKGYDKRGLVFYTNHESRKGTEALINPYASLVFPWFAMRRQVVVCGEVAPVSRAEAAEYFATRPRGSQLGAWASPQSAVVPDRAALEAGFQAAEQRFPGDVPMPERWGGFRVIPETVEFWQGRSNRLHDRLRYRRAERSATADGWIIERLAP